MHHRSGIVALLFGLTALSVAPRARADGFFVTFSPGQRVSPAVSRIAGASFDASGTSPIDAASGLSTGQTLTLPVHIEVDDVRLLAPLLSEETKFENVPLVTIEFTTPDAAGVEQVYMVGKYVNCTITAWQLAFDPLAAITTRSSVEFTYQTVTFTAPPTPKFAPPRPVAKEAPLLRRGTFVRRLEAPAAAVAPPVTRIDDAYLRMPPLPGESADHAGQIRLTAFKMTVLVPIERTSGLPTGRLLPKVLEMSKASGAASIALQNMFAQHTVAPSATITFNKHRPGTTDLTLETLALGSARLTAHTLQVSGTASTASFSVVYQTATLTDNRTSTDATIDWLAGP